MIKVSVVGAKGRMGSHVVDAVNAAADTELALALDAGDDLAAITPETPTSWWSSPCRACRWANVLALVKQGGRRRWWATTGWTEREARPGACRARSSSA